MHHPATPPEDLTTVSQRPKPEVLFSLLSEGMLEGRENISLGRSQKVLRDKRTVEISIECQLFHK